MDRLSLIKEDKFLKNLQMSREIYDRTSTSDIHREFVKVKDINNVIRVLTFEKKYMDEKIGVLKRFIDKLEKEGNKKVDDFIKSIKDPLMEK